MDPQTMTAATALFLTVAVSLMGRLPRFRHQDSRIHAGGDS